MTPFIDLLLVAVCVACAATYLILRKVRSRLRRERDWTTGHADATCGSCPVVKIREAKAGHAGFTR